MSHKTISDSSHVHPEVLVDTEWLEDHFQDQKLKLAELDHIPGTVLID
jgi:hypothetical protein